MPVSVPQILMNIEQCLLEKYNNRSLGVITVGESVARSGKEHLWDECPARSPDTIVIHYTSAVNVLPGDPYNFERIVQIFCEYQVSSHYLITREGAVIQLVPEEHAAWHSGGSIMPAPDNRRRVNDFSVGIELVGGEQDRFDDAQYESLQELIDTVELGRGGACKLVGHEDVAGERAVKIGLRTIPKYDPGPQFDWHRIRQPRFGYHIC
ncbi:MAG: hypothetical protein GF350_06000 [Chitinivibrionales bacterium]|nr:hypothetical protein [Chitinivibrionales bacterium]